MATEREAAAASERELPPSMETPITAQEVTDALRAHCLNPESSEARRDMRRALEQFLDRRAALSRAPQAVRMLTDDEIKFLVVPEREKWACEKAAIRKFCEVNGLGIVPPAPQEEGGK
jgi:hypothetical protein